MTEHTLWFFHHGAKEDAAEAKRQLAWARQYKKDGRSLKDIPRLVDNARFYWRQALQTERKYRSRNGDRLESERAVENAERRRLSNRRLVRRLVSAAAHAEDEQTQSNYDDVTALEIEVLRRLRRRT